MNILLIGKKNILNWIDNLNEAIPKKHKVDILFLNETGFYPDLKRNILKKISKNLMYKFVQNIIDQKIEKTKPDLIIFVSPFMYDQEIFEIFDNYPKIIKFAWIGDKFSPRHKKTADKFDKIFVTDTAFIADAKNFDFPPAKYLPLAVNNNIFYNKNLQRKEALLFIGSHTKKRVEFLSRIDNIDLEIIGPKWKDINYSNKKLSYFDKTINIDEVADYYNNYKYVLNIKHEHNVTNGLNMRTFEAIACGSCLLQDYVKDVELNFEIDKEIVVYNNQEELNQLIDKLNKDKDFYNSIVKNGEKAVLLRHTYKNRVDEILKEL